MSRDIVTPDAFDKVIERAAGKVVPLVVYEDGVRRIVGEAFVYEDGKIEAKIAEEVELPAALKAGMVIGASLGPLPSGDQVAEQLRKEAGFPPADVTLITGKDE